MHQVTPIDALNLVRMRGNTDQKNLKYGHFLPRAMQSEIVVLWLFYESLKRVQSYE